MIWFLSVTGFTRDPGDDVTNVSLNVEDTLPGHLVFTNPPVTPAFLGTLRLALTGTMVDARKGGVDRTRLKNIAKQALIDALMQDALYCQGLARHDLNTLLTSGYDIVSTNRTSGPLDTPGIIGILNNVSGQLTVRGQGVLNGRIYQVQASTDGGETFVNLGNFTSVRQMALTPVIPTTIYMVQICALGGSTGQSAWSSPLSIMAT